MTWFRMNQSFTFHSPKALLMTQTDLRLIAYSLMSGLGSRPNCGWLREETISNRIFITLSNELRGVISGRTLVRRG